MNELHETIYQEIKSIFKNDFLSKNLTHDSHKMLDVVEPKNLCC